MTNIYELERKWLKYKIKSYLPIVIITISIIAIGVILLIAFTSLNTSKITQTAPVKPIAAPEKTPHETAVPKDENRTLTNIASQKDIKKEALAIEEITPIGVNNLKKEQIVLTPSLNFMKNMQGNTPPQIYIVQEKENLQTNEPKNGKNKVFLQENNPSIEAIEEVRPLEPIQEKKKDDSINISRQNTQEDIEHVIQRFKKNNNPTLSLFIAKKYYELGQYSQSYNYSLITNQLNNNIEASWIIFTKSLVKLDKKDMAIKTLKQYIEHSHSNQAKILLDEITSGKFK